VASELEGAALGEGAAAGNINMPLLIRNRTASACYLEGFADVTVVDRAGRVVAQAVGAANRGTFFADWPPVPVLMKPGTTALPTTPSPGQQVSPGQATMNMSWYDCRQPQAAQLTLDLPAAGGRLVVPFSMKGSYSPACDSPSSSPFVSLSRGPLSPAGFSWPPAPDYITVAITVSAPPSVRRGSTLVYYVTLENTSRMDYRLGECPDYNEFLQAKAVVASFQLNCGPVAEIVPGTSATFQMKLVVPSEISTGPNDVTWALLDGRLASPVTQFPLVITS
jgi:hypothetical protein